MIDKRLRKELERGLYRLPEEQRWVFPTAWRIIEEGDTKRLIQSYIDSQQAVWADDPFWSKRLKPLPK